MAEWNPETKIIDTRFLGKNILSFVSENQAEALKWANGGESLKSFVQIVESVANRNAPNLPSLAILDDGNATDFDSDLLTTGYEITFEAMVGGADAEALPALAKRYAYALESMLANIPRLSLLASAAALLDAVVLSIETGFDEIKANDAQNYFMQMFQTKVIYRILATTA